MKITFSFGRNWISYVKNVVDENVIESAVRSLLRYLPPSVYKGKTFIDIGCGSGLFSLAALLLECKKVISFDIDSHSIKAACKLMERFSDKKSRWEIFQGSILDENLVLKLEKSGDIVYSWGVLHHTGDMWKAIRNASRLVKRGGYFIIAIYNHAPSSGFWLKVKKFYNKYPVLQPILIALYGGYISFGYMLRNKTLSLRKERGMHVFYDAIDWLGGLPYEYACAEDIKNYVESLGFALEKAPTSLPCGKGRKASILDKIMTKHTGCNEFVFRRRE